MQEEIVEQFRYSITEIILTMSKLKTFIKAADVLIYDNDTCSISDIQNIFDEISDKIQILDEKIQQLDKNANKLDLI